MYAEKNAIRYRKWKFFRKLLDYRMYQMEKGQDVYSI